MENTIDTADNFLKERNEIIGEPEYSERMFWAEILVEYGKLLQSDVIKSDCDHEWAWNPHNLDKIVCKKCYLELN